MPRVAIGGPHYLADATEIEMTDHTKPKAGVSEQEARKRVDSGKVPPPQSAKSYVANPSRPSDREAKPKKDEP